MPAIEKWETLSLEEAAERAKTAQNEILRRAIKGEIRCLVWLSEETYSTEGILISAAVGVPEKSIVELIENGRAHVSTFYSEDDEKIVVAEHWYEYPQKSGGLVDCGRDFLVCKIIEPVLRHSREPGVVTIVREDLRFTTQDIDTFSSHQENIVSENDHEQNEKIKYSGQLENSNLLIIAGMLSIATNKDGFERFKNQGDICEILTERNTVGKRTIEDRLGYGNKMLDHGIFDPKISGDEEKLDIFLIGALKRILFQKNPKRIFLTLDQVAENINGHNQGIVTADKKKIKTRLCVASQEEKIQKKVRNNR